MKKFLTLFIAMVFIAINLNAKDLKAEQMSSLKSELNSYINATKSGDVDTILDHTYPSIFKITPKEQLSKMLKQMYKMKKMPDIKEMAIKDIKAIESFSNGSFTTATYSMKMDMNVKGKDAKIQEMLVKALKEKMGDSASIKLDSNKSVIHIIKDSELIAIKEPKSNWKFINKTKALAMPKMLPSDVVSKLK